MRGDGIRRRKGKGKRAWWLSWTDEVGKRHCKKARSEDWELARRELEEIRKGVREIKSGTVVSRMTFKEAGQKYLEYQKPRLRSMEEWGRQESILRTHLGPFFAGPLLEVSRERINRYVASRKASPGTIQKEVMALRRLLNIAVREWRAIPFNPCLGVGLPPSPPARVRYLNPPEIEALLSHCSPKIRPVVSLALWTGMRKGEILGLRWMDVDLLNQRIVLPQSKSGKTRIVLLNESAMDVFRSMHLSLNAEPESNVFRLTSDEVFHNFISACQKARIQNFRFHDLRHTCASLMRQRGVQLDAIARQLGHADLRMAQKYAHIEEVQVREAVETLDGILSDRKATRTGKTGKTRPFLQ